MDELRAIATFIRAAELGSFHRAAQAQGSTPQAVSKAIRQLEAHLGVRLFHRTTRKNALTDEGTRLLDAVRGNLDGIRSAINEARGAAHQDQGLVRVSAGGAVARKVLMPVIAEFRAMYPEVQFELVLEDRYTDAVDERIDVGFRAGNAPVAQVVSRRLFPIQLLVCATPAYLAAHAAPRRIDDLAAHPLIGYRQPGAGQPTPWEFRVKGETEFRSLSYAVCCSDPEAEMHAVLAGIGIGQIDSINAAAPLRAGELVPLLPGSTSERMGLYLFYAQRNNMPRRVRRFIDFSVERLHGTTQFHVPPAALKAMAR
ncbi:LysR family transcriptional regulator [Burkholderia sp. 22PA0106]|uniref:LysR family transcriptional regulator n=1 Tax=Burkholderia sp. 22PA0106 TaxID=3237371 RepID=UPI0039C2CDC4